MSNEEERFCKNLTVLLSAISHTVKILTQNNVDTQNITPDTIELLKGFIQGYDKIKIIETFIKKSNKYWNKILVRDEKFFIENSSTIFPSIGNYDITILKTVFDAKNQKGDYIVNSNIKSQIFDIVIAMVKICIKYINNRDINKKFSDIDVKKLALDWTIKLD